MKKIAYIVLYFGKFDLLFPVWLETCRNNPSIDFLIFTDDNFNYNYPPNVKVHYLSFQQMKEKIQKNYDFKIYLDSAYKLCDFRPAYGEIFEEDLSGYDFWGYCDVDLLFGDIHSFIDDSILENYDKIGFQGHLTLYKNTEQIRKLYRKHEKYKNYLSEEGSFLFDELIISDFFEKEGFSVYKKVNFAHLSPLKYNFYLRHLPDSEEYKNKRQIFTIEKGHLYRNYILNKEILKEEFIYIHFFRRKMNVEIENDDFSDIIIYPNTISNKKINIDNKFIIKKSKNYQIKWYLKKLKEKRKNISIKKVITYIKLVIRRKK